MVKALLFPSRFHCLLIHKEVSSANLRAPTTMASPRKGSVSVDENKVGVTSVFTKRGDHAILEEGATGDEMTLGALGYKQEFKR